MYPTGSGRRAGGGVTMGSVSVPAGKTRVFAYAGVGPLRTGRWNDVDEADPMLGSWLAAGLVATTDRLGDPAPADLPQTCCGGA